MFIQSIDVIRTISHKNATIRIRQAFEIKNALVNTISILKVDKDTAVYLSAGNIVSIGIDRDLVIDNLQFAEDHIAPDDIREILEFLELDPTAEIFLTCSLSCKTGSWTNQDQF